MRRRQRWRLEWRSIRCRLLLQLWNNSAILVQRVPPLVWACKECSIETREKERPCMRPRYRSRQSLRSDAAILRLPDSRRVLLTAYPQRTRCDLRLLVQPRIASLIHREQRDEKTL